MKKFLLLFMVSIFMFGNNLFSAKKIVNNTKCDSKTEISLSSSYGIYGEVLWPVSGSAYNAVEGSTVSIFKWVNGSWVSWGSTVASMCGYYTFDTGGVGTYRAMISGYYYLRTYPGCASRVDYGMHAGSGDGVVTIGTPYIVVNVRCS